MAAATSVAVDSRSSAFAGSWVASVSLERASWVWAEVSPELGLVFDGLVDLGGVVVVGLTGGGHGGLELLVSGLVLGAERLEPGADTDEGAADAEHGRADPFAVLGD